MTIKDAIEELQADVEELRAAFACNRGEKTADEAFEMVDLEIRYIWAAISDIAAAIGDLSEKGGVDVNSISIPYLG
jgi:hypothetical protein